MLSTSSSCAEAPAPAGLSQQLTREREREPERNSKMLDERILSLEGCDLTYIYYTSNSSCSDVTSDITSPITPTFSARSQLRYSSSASSLEQLPLPQESPVSPSPAVSKTSSRTLPDVQEEEPIERDDYDGHDGHDDHEDDDLTDNFGLYSCLCDQACEHHRGSSEMIFSGDLANELGMEYDLGFLSDNDYISDQRRKKRVGSDAISSITSRFSVKIPGIARLKSLRQASSIPNVTSSPTRDRSLENVSSIGGEKRGSGVFSSRSSSLSSPIRRFPVILSDDLMPLDPAASCNESAESLHGSPELVCEEPSSIERDRSMATTPLLPPMMTDPLGKPPQKSPLQSPTIALSSMAIEVQPPPVASPRLQRTSLSARPSRTSLQLAGVISDFPLQLPPSFMQEQDEWSDRLGHANFTILPMPYELTAINAKTVTRFRDDWDAARVNYTKHLVRIGENYGHTSNIYALTEAKWAETEKKWKATYENIIRVTESATPAMAVSRSRSRGRGRARAEATLPACNRGYLSNDDVLAAVQWRRMEDCHPSAVPQLLEALDAEGKFPGRGDEDIVGPMQRDAYMVRARSEESKLPRFWRNLTEIWRR